MGRQAWGSSSCSLAEPSRCLQFALASVPADRELWHARICPVGNMLCHLLQMSLEGPAAEQLLLPGS